MPVTVLKVLVPYAVFLLLEAWIPLRLRQAMSKIKRFWINIRLAGIMFAFMQFVLYPVLILTSFWASTAHVGLLNIVEMPSFLKWIVAFFWFDFTYYLWHRINHTVPFLWCFHKVHHTDLDVDVTTTFRFHLGEIMLSLVFRVLQVLIIGPSSYMIILFEIVFQLTVPFQHSNLRLPTVVDRLLSYIIVTPRMHGIHHSVVPSELNSNFSSVSSLWDRLFRTLRLGVSQETLVLGLSDFQKEEQVGFWQLLKLPFVKS